jgi:rhodanese-related sulfurtransferase
MREHRTADELLADARERIERLEPLAARQAMEDGALLVDTRCADDRRAEGTVPGSVHVPLSVLPWRLDPTSGYDEPSLSDPSRHVVLICAHGYSSSFAAATLRDIGFTRIGDVIGGFEAWVAAGLPVVREPGPDLDR